MDLQDADKPIDWVGSSFQRLREFPVEARRQAGYQLRRAQGDLEHDDWKPMTAIGSGAMEIRIHEPHEHRVIYVAKFPEAIYVLHAFEKKTQKTSRKDIETARKAYEKVQRER